MKGTSKPIPERVINTFINLFERWQDERAYEDFEEYKTVMAKALPRAAKFQKMTTRPFMVEFVWHGRRFIRVRGGAVQWGSYGLGGGGR